MHAALTGGCVFASLGDCELMTCAVLPSDTITLPIAHEGMPPHFAEAMHFAAAIRGIGGTDADTGSTMREDPWHRDLMRGELLGDGADRPEVPITALAMHSGQTLEAESP